MKTTKKQAKTKNSVEKCEKKVSTPFKQLFSKNFISDPLNVFFKQIGANNFWII